MGTRHLIEVKSGGELKVAQYGQWDGYPTGQGIGIANFLHGVMDVEKFLTALAECSFASQQALEAIDIRHKATGFKWWEEMPWLSRDAGAGVLGMIQNGRARVLKDERDFKNDTLFCEYHYLIDMDSATISVNGRPAIPFHEWTVERMERLEQELRAEGSK